MINPMLRLAAMWSQAARDELARRKDLADAIARAKREAERRVRAEAAARARITAADDDNRRINYNLPINFLADTLDNHTRFPELTPAEWGAKKAVWMANGTFDAMYASTDPVIAREKCGPFGGKFAGQPYAVVEAEVRRLCMTP